MREKPPIDDDTPLRLAVAAELAFPHGGMTASGLRKESQRGRLVIERIAGKDFTTMRAISDMRKLCRVVPRSELADQLRKDESMARTRRALDKLRSPKVR